jgi:hypothetical protein
MVFCTYEDRPACLIGLKILILSLARHVPDARIRVWCPVGDPAFADFLSWLAKQENALPHPEQSLAGAGWNVKPAVLLYELEQGAEEAIWIDADIILGGDPSRMLRADRHTVLATEGMRWDETPKGTKERTEAWGYPVGRDIPGIVSSSIVRVTSAHRRLLEEWAKVLQSPEYIHWQRQPFWDRPPHAAGDQDVLMALLGAEEFAWIPIRYIPSGRGIAHCFFSVGYTTMERLSNSFRGPPPFVHAPSPVKPWNAKVPLSVEISPYTWVASKYGDELDEPMGWTQLRSRAGRLLNLIFLGEPNLRGLPLSLIREAKLYLDRGVDKVRHLAPRSGN